MNHDSGLAEQQVVEIYAIPSAASADGDTGGTRPERCCYGSGYLVAERLVLTAGHVLGAHDDHLAGPDTYSVRFGATGVADSHRAKVVWRSSGFDLAVLELTNSSGSRGAPTAARVGKLSSGFGSLPVTAACYPLHAVRTVAPGSGRPPDRVRECTRIVGDVKDEAAKTGRLEFSHDRLATGRDWSGASGGPVFCGDHLIGVIVQSKDNDAGLYLERLDVALGEHPEFLHGPHGHHAEAKALFNLLKAAGLGRADPVLPEGLGSYLAAASKLADFHPYRLPGNGDAPPLSQVYIRQHTRTDTALKPESSESDPGGTAGRPEDAEPDPGGTTGQPEDAERDPQAGTGPDPGDSAEDNGPTVLGPRLKAEVLLNVPGHSVVLAGPGGGKSTLLRHLLDDGVKKWREAPGSVALPVLVRASDLSIKGVASAAAAVLDDIGQTGAVRPQLFATRPHPRQPWLLLVDALDEAPDAVRVEAALKKFSNEGTFRIIVATRPLIGSEIQRLLPRAHRHQLQPLTRKELPEFAEAWFRASEVGNPGEMATRFTEAIKRAKLARIARTPLMAAMLCQLRVLNPDGPLPLARGELYRQFTNLLIDRSEPEPYQPMDTESCIRLIEEIAHGCLGNARLRALPLLAAVPGKSHRHSNAEWAHRVADQLARTGLLRVNGMDQKKPGRFEFRHQTVLEFLAARHAVRTPDVLHDDVRDVLPLRRTDGTYRIPKKKRHSYAGFLIEAAEFAANSTANQRPHLTRVCVDQLHEIADRDVAIDWLPPLLELGTPVPKKTLKVFTRYATTQAKQAERGSDRIRAAAALLGHAPKTGKQLLRRYTRDSGRSPARRIDAAQALLDHDTQYALEFLTKAVSDTTRRFKKFKAHDRLRAVRIAHGHSVDIGSSLALRLAEDDTLAPATRMDAAELVIENGPASAIKLLSAWASSRTPGFEAHDQLRAVRIVHGHSVDIGSSLALRLAEDDTLASSTRIAAARLVIDHDMRTGSPLVAHLARSGSLNSFARIEAAELLIDHDAETAVEVLTEFVSSPKHDRVREVGALLLVGVSTDPESALTFLVELVSDNSSPALLMDWSRRRWHRRNPLGWVLRAISHVVPTNPNLALRVLNIPALAALNAGEPPYEWRYTNWEMQWLRERAQEVLRKEQKN
ncbi:NACHT domain-containing protein [Streptomyces sp. NPDC017979]|uniref:NACHT domain-containing protein n=1 Tax=Streptomyces sp. NPDC017979 TaxID=3365024 RepID=UPI0037B29C87